MRPLAWILVGLLGVACTDDGKGGDDTGGTSGDDTGTSTDDTGDSADSDGDGFDGGADGDDCDDEDATVYPGAEEVPYDGIDQDCDEEDLTDVDGDGFDGGDDGDDCDDNDATVNPDAEEVAYDGIDQDCDGTDLTDVDGDGFDGGDEGDDCDDDDAAINSDAEEIPYDGIDQDCDGTDLTDVDGDGFDGGDEGDDCDDDDATTYPGAEEVPYDGIDQDCDEEDLTDVDGDGFEGGDEGDDCDDDDATIYPGAEDIAYDGVDSDCSGNDDFDQDGDGYVRDGDVGEMTYPVSTSGGLPGGDCDDGDASAYPGAGETPYDGIDQDCDGADLTDVDADGFDGGEEGDDCDDSDASINPAAEDTADLVDSDCDGLVDDDSIEPGDVIMSEAMVNPDVVLDSAGEWFELYNATDYDINVRNWTLSDDGDDDMTIEGDLIVPAGGYAVLGVNDDVDTNGGVSIDYLYAYGSLRLANTDDEFYLDMGDTEIYAIVWTAAEWPYDRGYSMGWDGSGDWTVGESWCAQTSMLSGGDYGTPGEDNDSCLELSCSLGEMGEVGMLGDTTDSSNDYETECGYFSWGYTSGPDDEYTFTAEEDGCYEFTGSVTDWSPIVALYTECGGEELNCASGEYVSSDDTGSIYAATLEYALDAGETVLVVIDGTVDSWGDYGAYGLTTAALDVSSLPAGEDLGSATGDYVAEGDTTGAESVADTSCGSSTPDPGDALFDWAAPSDGCWRFTTQYSDFDTVISVFTPGDACGDTEICDDDETFDGDYTYQSAVELDLTAGDAVQLLVSGYSGEGPYVLNINACPEG